MGAGRDKKNDPIDYSVGVFLNKKTGEPVANGDVLYTIYSNAPAKTEECKKYLDEAFEICTEKPAAIKQIYEIIKP